MVTNLWSLKLRKHKKYRLAVWRQRYVAQTKLCSHMLAWAQDRINSNPVNSMANKIYRFQVARLPRLVLLTQNKKLKQAAKIWTCARP
jgi:hypothetical protein